MALRNPLVLVGGVPAELPSGDSVNGWGLVSSVSASYTEAVTSGEKIVKVTASGQTITLPTAISNTARLTYKLMVAGTLTLACFGAQTIDEGTTAAIATQYTALTVVSDGANWIVV